MPAACWWSTPLKRSFDCEYQDMSPYISSAGSVDDSSACDASTGIEMGFFRSRDMRDFGAASDARPSVWLLRRLSAYESHVVFRSTRKNIRIFILRGGGISDMDGTTSLPGSQLSSSVSAGEEICGEAEQMRQTVCEYGSLTIFQLVLFFNAK